MKDLLVIGLLGSSMTSVITGVVLGFLLDSRDVLIYGSLGLLAFFSVALVFAIGLTKLGEVVVNSIEKRRKNG